MTIRAVAEQTGVSPHTLRYYERIGLIEGVQRANNSHRVYCQADIVWIEFLKRLRATGMSIADMKRFASLRRQGASSLTARQDMLQAHYDHVLIQITELQENLEAIEAKIGRLAAQQDTLTHS
jgi:DNA-binding transcriptional MerR regulator